MPASAPRSRPWSGHRDPSRCPSRRQTGRCTRSGRATSYSRKPASDGGGNPLPRSGSPENRSAPARLRLYADALTYRAVRPGRADAPGNHVFRVGLWDLFTECGMSRKTLNLGILAHVDAGKTTLTERLLFDSGVIGQLGAVDAGTTQTDSLPLERQRGITIRSAVASFPIGDVTVNLIDTPGHPDFIAEVDRVLTVLDGVVLVISAVEGVQAQTRILMRSLQRLGIPALLFVNKIDRSGADPGKALQGIARRLKITPFAMGGVTGAGTRGAAVTAHGADDAEFTAGMTELLAGNNDKLLAAYVHSEAGMPYGQLRNELAQQARRGLVYPVFFGSAITGAGIAPLTAGIASLLPAPDGDPAGPLSGRIFKIERGSRAEKIAYVRTFSGTVHVRDRLRFGSRRPGRPGAAEDPGGPSDRGGPAGASGASGKVTAVAVFERGP